MLRANLFCITSALHYLLEFLMAPADNGGGRGFHLKRSFKTVFPFRCFTGARHASTSLPRPQVADHAAHPPNSIAPAVDQQNLPTPASSLDPALAFQLQNITLADVDKLLEFIGTQLKIRAPPDPNKASSSSDTIERKISECQKLIEGANTFVQTLPKSLTKEIMRDILKKALGGLGGVHWVGMGLSLIAWSIGNIDQTSQNHKDFLDLLDQVFSLLSNTRTLLDKEEIYENHQRMQDVQKIFQVALECALLCAPTLDEYYILRFLKASNEKEAIIRLQGKVTRALEKYSAIGLGILVDAAPKAPHQYVLVDDKMVGGEVVVKKAMTILEAKSDNIVGLGLHGMGGIGKSTVGLRIFGEFQKMEYDCCRVELAIDITDAGLPKIQKEIVEKLSKRNIPEISNAVDGRAMMKARLRVGQKPLFLYIDNVMEERHLSALLPDSACFPPGSRILITCRDESIVHVFRTLGIEEEEIKVGKLNPQEAKELFWQQFKKGISTRSERSREAFQKLEEDVLRHCDGLPLALIIVGRYIASSEGNPLDSKLWKEVIKAMQKAQPLGGQEKDPLYARIKHVSIDGLAASFRSSFVDIAFFGEGLEWDTAELLVGKIHIHALHRRALVQKVYGLSWQGGYSTVVKVHDVIRSIGVEMARNDQAELRIEGNDEFQRNVGSLEKVVGLKSVRVHEPQLLRRMGHLRVLIDVELREEYKTGGYEPGEFEEISRAEYETGEFKELVVAKLQSHYTYLPFCIGGCPKLKELSLIHPPGMTVASSSSSFDFKVLGGSTQLEVLAIDCSSRALKNLEEIGCLTELRVLELHVAWRAKLRRKLEEIGKLERGNWESFHSLPETIFTSCTGLEKLSLRHCDSLVSLPHGIGSLTGLTELDLSGCEGLTSLPDGITNLTGLTRLDLNGCESLTSLPDGITNLTGLTELGLSGCESLTSLPDGISNLSGLTWLNLHGCKSLASLPDGITNLTGLKCVDLSTCESLTSLPDGITNLTGLTWLFLWGCKSLTSLPDGISNLTGLTKLDLLGCESLTSLPDGISNLTGLTWLNLNGCESLTSLPDGIANLTGLKRLDLRGCESLTSLPDGMANLTGLTLLRE